VAKELRQLVESQMEESLRALSDTVRIFEKRSGLKIVGKPYEGKPHVRFDEGLLGRPKVAPEAYSAIAYHI